MPIFRCGSDTVYVVRAPLVLDSRTQTPHRNWASATETAIEWCSVQDYVSVSDDVDRKQREYAAGWFQCWAPANAPIIPEHTDRIRFDGQVYEMRGHTRTWRNRYNVIHHYHWVMELRTESAQ